ncbi:MAG TPA: CheR family methyltransferase [Aliidongia sp.]|nr:CheR family methyltransferase [Aliidongia sp.]
MDRSAIAHALDINGLGKSLGRVFSGLNEPLWGAIPPWMTRRGPLRTYGSCLHAIARMRSDRRFYFGTFFFRNRPQLELARRLSGELPDPKITILACSIGAEVYSILWALRSGRPGLKIAANAVDISEEALEFGRGGIYPLAGSHLTDQKIFARLTNLEKHGLFDVEANRLNVKAWLKEGITWRIGDAANPRLVELLGPQDLVFANNFLCHMQAEDAERCLRNIVKLVRPGGYLFVSGIDLDVRTKVARDLGLEPVIDLMEEAHNGDPSLLKDWPFRYWGLEPFDPRRQDWKTRYSSAFRRHRPAGARMAETISPATDPPIA